MPGRRPGLVPRRRCGFVPRRRCGFGPRRRCGFVPWRRCGFVPWRRCGFVPWRRCEFVPWRRRGFVPRRRRRFVRRRRCRFVPRCRRGLRQRCRRGFVPRFCRRGRRGFRLRCRRSRREAPPPRGEHGGPGVHPRLGRGGQGDRRRVQRSGAARGLCAEGSPAELAGGPVPDHDGVSGQPAGGGALHPHRDREPGSRGDGGRRPPDGDARRMRRLRLVGHRRASRQAFPPFTAASRPAMRPKTRQRPRPCCAKPPCDSPAQ